MLSDWREGAAGLHLGLEALAVLAALVGVCALLREHAAARRSAAAALLEAAQARRLAGDWEAEATRWRAEAEAAIRGLGEALDRQFQRWSLSPAEAEVALLLLKGLAMKEIAAVRGVSERTVREEAQAVYGKAGLAGRAELSAFFLEDLLLPAPTGP